MATFGEMKTRIAGEFVNESVTDAQIGEAINSAIAGFAGQSFFFNSTRGSFSTVASQEFYGASDYDQIPDMAYISMVKYDGDVLIRVNSDDIDDTQDGTVTGDPTHFAYVNRQIRLYPIPEGAATVTVAFTKRYDALSDDEDENPWTSDAEELIRQCAKRIIALDILHADDMAARCGVREAEAMAALKRETARRRTDAPLRASEVAAMLTNPVTFGA